MTLPTATVVAQDIRSSPPVRLDTVKSTTAAPVLDRETLGRGHKMLHDVWGALKEFYYDTAFAGIDTAAAVNAANASIEQAPDQAHMVASLVTFLDGFKDSHTYLIPPGLAASVDYGWTWQIMGEKCFATDVKEGSDAAVQGLRLGDEIVAIDRIRPTRENIYTVSLAYYRLRMRPGMHLSVIHADGTPAQFTIKSKITQETSVYDIQDPDVRRRLQYEAELHGRPVHLTKVINDSVFVWHIGTFGYEDDEIDHLMDRAARYKGLILDLRGNGGGAEEALLRLLGHFFPQPFVAVRVKTRGKVDSLYVRPNGKLFTGDAVVLIDSRSASASELVARTLQMKGRATIVGDRSAGAVMRAYQLGFSLDVNRERSIPYRMSVTVSDPVMADGGRLENNGVIPNVADVPTAQDLLNHRDPVMSFALELLGVKMDPVSAAKVLGQH
ncbi:MAG TPA: S41 family peptidase [Gemmatimonadales bacterium]